MACYLDAFKTSLGDVSQGEWNTLEGLTDEDSMGATIQATMMVRHLFGHYACILPYTWSNQKFFIFLAGYLILTKEP